MEVIYTVDLNVTNDHPQLKPILIMDISCLNILAFSSSYLSVSNQLKYKPYTVSPSLHKTAESSFCIYICPLEQPWYINLITTSTVPIVQIVWSLDGTHLLVCNQTGICQIFQMKNGCINTMENIYQYEINEDILYAKYAFYREPIIVNLDRNESLFYEKEHNQSPFLQYALNSGNFICVTSSGTIHTLPITRSLTPYSYPLSQNEPLCVSLCNIYPTDQGFNVVLSENICGALVQFFIVHYVSLEPRISYVSYRSRGFRIPSPDGKLESLLYFQRNGIDCILTYMKSFSGDLIDLYEYNKEREEWISITLLNSPQAYITSISLSPSQFLIEDNNYFGLFGRQMLVSLSDGSIVCFDKLNLKCRGQYFLFENLNDGNQTDFFLQIKHTSSGSCCVGFTQNNHIVLFRTIALSQIPSMTDILVHLFEQYIVQNPCPCDIWDRLCLITNNSIINQLIDRLVTNFENQSLEFKRTYFIRLKECFYHFHRLACPSSKDSCEHLTSLLVYSILLSVRDYLRLYVYDPPNRNFVDAAQEILHQTSFIQNIDITRIKYVSDPAINIDRYESTSLIKLINWITDIILYFIGYAQIQTITSSSITCQHIFHDSKQIQWLREFIIYFYILYKINKISNSKISYLQLTFSQQQQTNNSNEQKDLLKDLYHSLTKFSQQIEMQNPNLLNENLLEDFSVLDIELLQSKADSLFPKSYPYFLPNSPFPQKFLRDQPPFDTNNSLKFNEFFDIITTDKLSFSSNSTSYRRCLRCSNFSRIYSNEPYPLLAYRLNHRCLCGGLFLHYTR